MSSSMDTKDISKNIRVIGYAVLGIVIFVLHILVFYLNQYMFNVLVCCYVVVYALVTLISVTKNKDCFNKPLFNILTYFSLYTVVLQVFLLIFTIVMYMKRK